MENRREQSIEGASAAKLPAAWSGPRAARRACPSRLAGRTQTMSWRRAKLSRTPATSPPRLPTHLPPCFLNKYSPQLPLSQLASRRVAAAAVSSTAAVSARYKPRGFCRCLSGCISHYPSASVIITPQPTVHKRAARQRGSTQGRWPGSLQHAKKRCHKRLRLQSGSVHLEPRLRSVGLRSPSRVMPTVTT
jgi:hypothetical protein